MILDVQVSGDLLGATLRGGERHGLELARALRERGHALRLFCSGVETTRSRGELDGFEVIRLPKLVPLPGLWRLGRPAMLASLAAALLPVPSSADAVVALSPWLTLAARCTHPRRPVLYVAADLLCASEAFEQGRTFDFPHESWRHLGVEAWVERQAYRASVTSVLYTQWMLEGLVRSGVPRNRLAVLQPGPCCATPADGDRAGARRQLGLSEGPFLVAYVGALTARKNPSAIVEAIRLAPSHVHAMFVGEGPEGDALRRRSAQLGVTDRVHFMGWLPDPSTAYIAADVLCHPALYETFGLVYLEAMQHGRPVMAPRHDPPRVFSAGSELITDGVEGVLFDATIPADLAGRLTQLADAPTVTAAMGARAQRRAAGLTWSNYAEGLEHLLVAAVPPKTR